MQIQNRVAVEANLGGLLDQKLYRGLVIQNHLGFPSIFAFGALSQFQQALGFEQGVGVAFQTAGIPRQVDQQSAEDLTRIGPSRTLTVRGSPQFEETLPSIRREIETFVRPVRVQKRAVISDRLTILKRLANSFLDGFSIWRNWNICFATRFCCAAADSDTTSLHHCDCESIPTCATAPFNR